MKTNNTAYSKGKPLATVESVEGKQDKLTAGDNITIENNVISASREVWEEVPHNVGTIEDDFTGITCQNVSINQKIRVLYTNIEKNEGVTSADAIIISPTVSFIKTPGFVTVPNVYCVDGYEGYIDFSLYAGGGNLFITLNYGTDMTGFFKPEIVKVERLIENE